MSFQARSFNTRLSQRGVSNEKKFFQRLNVAYRILSKNALCVPSNQVIHESNKTNLLRELANFIISIIMFQLIKRACCLKFEIANVHEMNIKKQPPEVLYKKAVPKSLPIFAGNTCAGAFFYSKYKASVLGRYWKEIPAQVFFCEYYETFKNTYFEKTCKRLLLNNVKRDYSSMKTAK